MEYNRYYEDVYNQFDRQSFVLVLLGKAYAKPEINIGP